MFGYILTGFICYVLGIITWYWHDRKIINAKQEFDQAVILENERIIRENEDLVHYKQNLENDIIKALAELKQIELRKSFDIYYSSK